MSERHAPLACAEAEVRLLEGSPADAAAPPPDLAAHLARCAACAELAATLAALEPLAAPPPGPDDALVQRTFVAAAAEARAIATARRRVVRRAGVRVAAIFLATLPLLLGFQALVASVGRSVLPSLLPDGVLVYVAAVWALAVLAGLSTLAFTLTLVAGAAARPPRDELLEAFDG